MVDSRSVVYKVADGCELVLDVYESPTAGPVVVWLHGGALITGSRRSVREGGQRALARMLAMAGFTQVAVDYRLAPETKLPEIVADVRDAWCWVVARFGAGALLGHSAGGYLSLLGGAVLEPRPRAIVSLYGYGDIAGPWYAEPDPFYRAQREIPAAEARAAVGVTPLSEPPPGADRWRFYVHCRQVGSWIREVAGEELAVDPAALGRYCPERLVDSGFPPTLLIHGTADTDVPYARSAEMAGSLAAAGVPHELVTIDGGGHGFDHVVTDADLASASPSPVAAALLRPRAFLERELRA
ncbi:MAG: alpha/beta hydrolase [Gaiellales bacterium]